MKKILIFIGPPGSGKGTQAKKIANRNNYAHISTGALLRARLESGDYPPDEAKVLPEIREGHMVPNWLAYRLTFLEIEKQLKVKKGIILDGAVRSLEQAKVYQEYFKANKLDKKILVVYISLSDEESYDRLIKRRVCSSCRANIPYLKETKDLKRCPYCKGKLIKRQDDTTEVIKDRIKNQGESVLLPIVDFYKNLGVLTEIEGKGNIKDIEKKVEKAIY